jgi:hypothetical protein
MNKAIRSFHRRPAPQLPWSLWRRPGAVWLHRPIEARLAAKAIYTDWDRSRRPPRPTQPPSATKPQKPSAAGDSAEVAALKDQLKQRWQRITELEVEIHRLETIGGELPRKLPTAAMMAVMRRQETAARKTKRDEARAQQLAAQLAEPGAPDAATLLADNEELKRQLKAARTRIHDLSVEARMAWQASKANPVAITKKLRSPRFPSRQRNLRGEKEGAHRRAADLQCLEVECDRCGAGTLNRPPERLARVRLAGCQANAGAIIETDVNSSFAKTCRLRFSPCRGLFYFPVSTRCAGVAGGYWTDISEHQVTQKYRSDTSDAKAGPALQINEIATVV